MEALLIKKILVANRGEIAVRVIRACREMGIQSVAVFSDADRLASHVLLADEAYPIGPPPAKESYLRGDKVIAVAEQCGADAIHPGYGFLSENAEFAQAVKDAGIIWIGPPPAAIKSMGSKTEARAIMMKAGVPIVPGTPEGVENPEIAKRYASEIGYPVLIKAAMGGGGKGMRVVHEEKDLAKSLDAARRESMSAFSSPVVFIEKFVEKPRHIEFQVFADHHGNVIHLCERECSIQRRHQKVIEESPSPVMNPELRERMGESAVEAARACGYQNAGTVEFLVDKDLNYYFLEMNTRLQVEHPITEMVTGVDLCKLQIRVAAGEELPIKQDDVVQRGHAIEVRIYSEDSLNNFLPTTGKIHYLHPPDGFGLREDSGVREGEAISIHYDPMISKLIAWDADRISAIRRMKRALMEYNITGVRTTIPFGIYVMDNDAFQKGDYDTSFVEKELDVAVLREQEASWQKVAALAVAFKRHEMKQQGVMQVSAPGDNGKTPSANGWAPTGCGWKNAGRRAALR